MADNDGVTQLLKAEAEANKIIQQAHEERYKNFIDCPKNLIIDKKS